MSSWILQHFLNPAFFWPGVALLSVPILIHLINRLNYRKVKFAAMEFLLASQKRNRRKVLIEQLLLLLLRLGLMMILVALFARLIIDPDQLSLFQGARSHHVVILDDTASMEDQSGDSTPFGAAREVIRRMIAEGARRPGTQVLSLIRLSAPGDTVGGLSERAVDETLLTELAERLDTMSCTHQTANPARALKSAQERLANDQASVRHIHILSDFRSIDWQDNKEAAATLREMDQAGIRVNLVRCAEARHENLGIDELGGSVDVAAAGVPVTLSATVRNWGQRAAQDVRGLLFVDDVRLPRTIDFQSIPAGEFVQRNFDIIFNSAQPHRIRVEIGDDALAADNHRFLAINVAEAHPVLIVDGSPGAEQGQYIADALAADRSVTGFAPELRTPDDLRRVDLDKFPLLYLINVPELEADAVAALEGYVRRGGGLVWYMGDAVKPAWYNTNLFRPEGGLFPVRLGPVPVTIDHSPGAAAGTAPEPGQHPLFSLLTGREVPILDLVIINLLYPVDSSASGESSMARDVATVASLQGRPLMLEHQLGAGRIFTCLTSAGPLPNPEGVVWSNWANGPAGFSFVILQLEIAKSLIRKDSARPTLETGAPIQVEFNPALYKPEVEVIQPNDQVTHLQAERSPAGNDPSDLSMQARFRQTDDPGVYSVLLTGQDQQQTRLLYAFNVPAREGALELTDDPQLLNELDGASHLTIQKAGSFDWIRSESPGSEVRWFLLTALAIFCLIEQALASRMSRQGG